MFKSLAVLIGGMFVGAVAMEVLRKTCPGALDKAYERTREIASGAKEAFSRGYEGVTAPREAPEPTA
jgi:hypothetical protein